MMKVIILCANYEPGGAQRAAIRLNDEFNRRGISCKCLFLHRKGENFSAKPEIILNRKISSVGDILKVAKRLSSELKKSKADTVISFLPYANILGQLVSLFYGVKKRISSHRNLSYKELSTTLKFLDYMWAHLGIYSGITAVSKSTKESFHYYNKSVFDRIKVINNGLCFAPSVLPKKDCRKILGLDDTSFIIGNVGRLVHQKNHLLLINILPSLPGIFLVIVGKGELRSGLEQRAIELGVSSRIIIIEELNADFVPYFFKAIDIFVMPSLFEGMSNALAEALYAGVPIISSDVKSQRDVLVRDADGLHAGVLVSNKKPNEWVNAILAVRENEKVRHEISENALIRAKDFSIENMAEGFISCVNEL